MIDLVSFLVVPSNSRSFIVHQTQSSKCQSSNQKTTVIKRSIYFLFILYRVTRWVNGVIRCKCYFDLVNGGYTSNLIPLISCQIFRGWKFTDLHPLAVVTRWLLVGYPWLLVEIAKKWVSTKKPGTSIHFSIFLRNYHTALALQLVCIAEILEKTIQHASILELYFCQNA